MSSVTQSGGSPALDSEAVKPGSVLPKACENCRIRKIRCDKSSPCSSCQMVNLPCRVGGAASKARAVDGPRSPRPIAAPASYHERHFNLIHDSLSDIKEKLRKLGSDQSRPIAVDNREVSTQQINLSSAEQTFHGETSFSSHQVLASESAENSAKLALKNGRENNLSASLSSLKSLLRNQGRSSLEDNLSFQSAPKTKTSNLDLPPVAAVLAVLRRASKHAPFVMIHSAQRDHSMLEELCKKIYFATKPYSNGESTLMNGLLSFVFFEYSANPDSTISSTECAKYGKLCETKFITGLQDYECLVTPKLENIQCLMIGAMKAQEDSLPSLCWTFVSAGARLCQILGYHRESVVARDPPEQAEAKRHVFWMLYMIDKTLSLNLGRTSCFPDDDIDVKVFSASKDPRFFPWDQAFLAFIEFSRLQGRIYDELYTAKAQRAKPELRSQAVDQLSSMFSAWNIKFKEIRTSGAQDKNDLDLIVGSSDFIYYSALNLLYGAKTSPVAATHISSKRYEVARLSLQCHLRNTAGLLPSDMPRWRIYADWILLYSSFTPFLVVFTHAIASHSHENIELLEQVLNTLETPRGHSEAVNKLYQVCRGFLNFARAFVPSQQPSFGCYNQEEDSFTFALNNDTPLVYETEGLAGLGEGDLESMSAFLGNCLGENTTFAGLWNMDVSSTSWM